MVPDEEPFTAEPYGHRRQRRPRRPGPVRQRRARADARRRASGRTSYAPLAGARARPAPAPPKPSTGGRHVTTWAPLTASLRRPRRPAGIGRGDRARAAAAYLEALGGGVTAPQGRARRAGRGRAGVAAQGRAHRRHDAVDGAVEGRPDRYQLLLAVWDGGRVLAAERERLATLIWGRLDATLDPACAGRAPRADAGALAVSLPEACRLSDALVGQLRAAARRSTRPPTRTPPGSRTCAPQLERLRDQVALEPDGTPRRGAQRTLGRAGRARSRTSPSAPSAAATSAACSARSRTTPPASSATSSSAAPSAARPATGPRGARAARRTCVARAAALAQLADALRRRPSTRRPATPCPTSTALGPVPDTPPELAAYRTGSRGRRRDDPRPRAYAAALARPRRPGRPARRPAPQGRGPRPRRGADLAAADATGPRGARRAGPARWRVAGALVDAYDDLARPARRSPARTAAKDSA